MDGAPSRDLSRAGGRNAGRLNDVVGLVTVEGSLIFKLTPLCIKVLSLLYCLKLPAMVTTIIVETPHNDRRIQV
jgi:hypothetical protein